MADFIEIARLDQIPPGSGSRFTVADKDVAVFNVDGTICVIADTCPHAGGSLGLGKLDGSDRDLSGARNEVRRHHRMLCGHFELWGRLLPRKVVDEKIMVSLSPNEKTIEQ